MESHHATPRHATQRHAWLPLECLWKPHLTLPVPQEKQRWTGASLCPRPERQSALGRDQSVGVSCPEPPPPASPRAATQPWKNKLQKAQPVPTQPLWAPGALHRACKRTQWWPDLAFTLLSCGWHPRAGQALPPPPSPSDTRPVLGAYHASLALMLMQPES